MMARPVFSQQSRAYLGAQQWNQRARLVTAFPDLNPIENPWPRVNRLMDKLRPTMIRKSLSVGNTMVMFVCEEDDARM
jgi:hypothetical protein